MRITMLTLALLAAACTSCAYRDAIAGLVPSGPDPEELAAIHFDGGTAVTVHGIATEFLFPKSGGPGMLVVQQGSKKWAFSTASNREMARQGFLRTSLTAGEAVVVTGVLSRDGQQLGEFTPGRAETITAAGRKLFERTRDLTSAVPRR